MPIQITFLRDIDHGGSPDQLLSVATLLADFIRPATTNLHLAIYDFRLTRGTPAYDAVVGALQERAAAGVECKIAYDQGKDRAGPGVADPAPVGTALFLRQAFGDTAIECRSITDRNPFHLEPRLMHDKYIVRDAGTDHGAVWTGSSNLAEDSWTYQENNLVQIPSSDLARYFETDFQEMWSRGDIDTTGENDEGTVQVNGAAVDVAFSPGEGMTIDQRVVAMIHSARRRIKVCSMLLAARPVLIALETALQTGQVREFGGIYDSTQMQQTLTNWQDVPRNNDLIPLFHGIAGALASKASLPFSPDQKHNFMHNKCLVCDDTVFTGSFNLSRSATQNAENILMIHDAAIADQYSAYIEELIAAYAGQAAAPAHGPAES